MGGYRSDQGAYADSLPAVGGGPMLSDLPRASPSPTPSEIDGSRGSDYASDAISSRSESVYDPPKDGRGSWSEALAEVASESSGDSGDRASRQVPQQRRYQLDGKFAEDRQQALRDEDRRSLREGSGRADDRDLDTPQNTPDHAGQGKTREAEQESQAERNRDSRGKRRDKTRSVLP